MSREQLLKRLTSRNKICGNIQYVSEEMLNDCIDRFDIPTNEDVELISG